MYMKIDCNYVFFYIFSMPELQFIKNQCITFSSKVHILYDSIAKHYNISTILNTKLYIVYLIAYIA